MNINKPEKSEYNPYSQHYIDLVAAGDFQHDWIANTKETIDFFENIPLAKHDYKYAVNKWTIKEILMHIIDTERVFAYRALVCIRGDDKTIIHNMDEDLYAANVDVTQRSMASLIEEFKIVRENSNLLFQNMTEEQSKFLGNAITHHISARALAWIMIGHIVHHMKIIQERYL